jgi:hypothetical protein
VYVFNTGESQTGYKQLPGVFITGKSQIPLPGVFTDMKSRYPGVLTTGELRHFGVFTTRESRLPCIFTTGDLRLPGVFTTGESFLQFLFVLRPCNGLQRDNHLKKFNMGDYVYPLEKGLRLKSLFIQALSDRFQSGEYMEESLANTNNSTNILYTPKLLYIVSIGNRFEAKY